MFFAPLPSDPSYLDPVATGTILQVLLAVFLAVSLFFRAFWRKIKSFIAMIQDRFAKKDDEAVSEKSE
ncbi:MAG TPA: hypothetical protein PKK96_01520 [Anaerolineales bacterium]|nr:hypothetical protein [Anaerolineales bacterium]HMS00473.1 hypothetical protein [Anaerolineales bacterium]HNQ94155.1 hypothetical protein [Anaerolineales bacterium]HNS59656.1 hypothetical protein [Anaerolineales bacterium]